MNKTAEEILREKIENELGDLSSDDNFLRLIHFPNVAVLAAMEEYAAQFAAPPPASEGRVLICENCKAIWIGPKDKCDCGSTSLISTHNSNYIYAKNCKVAQLGTGVGMEIIAEAHASELYNKESNNMIDVVEGVLWQNRKSNFIEGFKAALATLPTMEPEAKEIDDFISELMQSDPIRFVKYCLIIIGRDILDSGAVSLKLSVESDLREGRRFAVNVTGKIKELK